MKPNGIPSSAFKDRDKDDRSKEVRSAFSAYLPPTFPQFQKDKDFENDTSTPQYIVSTPTVTNTSSFQLSPMTPGLASFNITSPNISLTSSFSSIKHLKADIENYLKESTPLKRRKVDDKTQPTNDNVFQLSEAFSTIEKQRDTIQELEAQITRLREESKSDRLQTTTLESKITELQAKNILCEQQVQQKDSEITHQLSLNEELKQHLKFVSDEIAELKTQLQKKDTELSLMKSKTASSSASLEAQKSSLEDQIYSQQQTISRYKTQMEQQRLSLQKQLDTANAQIEHFEQQVESYKNQITQYKQNILDLTSQSESRKTSFSSNQEYETIIKNLKDEITHLKTVEAAHKQSIKQVKQLQEQSANASLLNEQILQQQAKLERAAQLQHKYNELQLQYSKLQEQTNQWDSLLRGLKEFNNPTEIWNRMNQLQKENEMLLLEQGNSKGSVTTLQANLEQATAKIAQLEQQAAKLNKTISEHEENFKKLEKWNSILKKERDGYKSILDSYNEEDAIHSNYDKQKTARINELERSMAEKHNFIQTALASLSTPAVTPATLNAEEVEVLRSQIAKLNKENEKLIEEISVLESRLGKGEFNPQTTKILHLALNPTNWNKPTDELAILKAENENLKKLLAAQGISTTSVASSEEVKALTAENQLLQKKLADSEARLNKLKEAWKRQIHELREMMLKLFGYKVNIVEKEYRLESMYAQNEIIAFEKSSEGGLNLLETEFTKTLSKEIHAYLSKCHSIPAFLSNITLQLFERQTFH